MLNPFKRLVIKGVPFDVKDGGAVRFDESTSLTDAEKARARQNIGADESGVTSVNGQTGAVELDAGDVGALPDSTVIPSKTSQLQNDSGFITSGQAPVQSVNGLTGAVSIAIPSKTSDLQNDSGFITSSQAPVQSVDGKTGSVTILPIGGSTETVLTKNNVNDYDASWKQLKLHYAQVDSSSTATAFTATVPGVTALEDGAFCFLKNGVVTSASGCTLDVNGLGAKPIYQTLAAASAITTQFNINYTMLFLYDTSRVSTGCWLMFYGYNTDNNTIGYQIRTAGVSMTVDGATYRYRLLFQSKDGNKFVPANTSSSTSATAAKTVNQTPINPFGIIMYYGTTTAVSNGAKPNASYIWEQYNDISLGYSFNVTGSALTLTASKPVYLKCAPRSDGTAIMDSATPIVQDLPTTEDGKIYIFLGIASSATAFMLMLQHPVYYFKDNAIRVWTNQSSSGGGGGAVDSVNGQTGVVVLTASDVGALPDNTVIPSKTSDLTNDSGFITSSGAPVQSVNGQTGSVSISVPSKTSDLQNDSGFITSSGAPVQSVNGQTGAVSLTASSVGAEQSKLKFSNVSVASSAFVSDSTYAGWAYRASVSLSGVTASYVAEVVFGMSEATSGKFAPVCDTYSGGVYIYASEAPSSSIVIPTILVWR